ncbi:MAG: zinc ABC transporter substrate-binding protein [Verrucomicrobiales bacterium]|nr:zinc ABC transporter substrate-binding protein [Verrucomicrobiales bacterium]
MIRPSTLSLAGLSLGFLLPVASCDRAPSDGATAAPESGQMHSGVQVTNYPLDFFASTLLGDRLPVHFLAPAEGDPAFWEPTDADVSALQQADCILLNGATYEKWLPSVSLPQGKLVDTSEAFSDRWIVVKSEVTHRHGPGGDHSHAGTAFTTWIDFQQAAEQVRAIQKAVTPLLPEIEQPEVAARADRLLADLAVLDARMAKVAERMKGVALLASHPIYQYWARRYGLDVTQLHWEPDQGLSDEQWAEFEKAQKAHPAQWLIWEAEPLPASVERLKATGVTSLVFDPCGNRPETGDFLSVMRQNIADLETAFPQP